MAPATSTLPGDGSLTDTDEPLDEPLDACTSMTRSCDFTSNGSRPGFKANPTTADPGATTGPLASWPGASKLPGTRLTAVTRPITLSRSAAGTVWICGSEE